MSDQNDDQHEQGNTKSLELTVARIGEGARHAVDHFVSVGRPPPAQLMPIRISEMPMTKMIVPVTTGGKRGKSLLMKGAAMTANTPAAMTDAVDAEQSHVRRGGHRQHRPDGRERDTHHHGQANADVRKADALNERREPAREQVGADEECDVFGGKLQRAPEDQRYRDRPRIHYQHVLQA